MEKITLDELLDRIHCANADELPSIMTALRDRFGELWPDCELAMLSIPGHTAEDHIAVLRQSLDMLTRQAKNDLP